MTDPTTCPQFKQLWLCRDADGSTSLLDALPEWDVDVWLCNGHIEEVGACFAEAANLLPGQAVALHTGEVLRGDNPHD